MARGGGGGGRGGGGARGGSRGRGYSSSKSWEQMTPVERVLSVLFFGFVLVIAFFAGEGDSGSMASEDQLSDFASAQYLQYFGETESYEDNLLLAFVVYEDCERFSYMTWVGDHINEATFNQLRGEGTWLDAMLSRQLESDYRHTISADLSRAIRELADKIRTEAPVGSYTCSEDHDNNPSGLRSRTELKLNAELIGESLDYFRETTGIPIVLVVEDATDLFQ